MNSKHDDHNLQLVSMFLLIFLKRIFQCFARTHAKQRIMLTAMHLLHILFVCYIEHDGIYGRKERNWKLISLTWSSTFHKHERVLGKWCNNTHILVLCVTLRIALWMVCLNDPGNTISITTGVLKPSPYQYHYQLKSMPNTWNYGIASQKVW